MNDKFKLLLNKLNIYSHLFNKEWNGFDFNHCHRSASQIIIRIPIGYYWLCLLICWDDWSNVEKRKSVESLVAPVQGAGTAVAVDVVAPVMMPTCWASCRKNRKEEKNKGLPLRLDAEMPIAVHCQMLGGKRDETKDKPQTNEPVISYLTHHSLYEMQANYCLSELWQDSFFPRKEKERSYESNSVLAPTNNSTAGLYRQTQPAS